MDGKLRDVLTQVLSVMKPLPSRKGAPPICPDFCYITDEQAREFGLTQEVLDRLPFEVYEITTIPEIIDDDMVGNEPVHQFRRTALERFLTPEAQVNGVAHGITGAVRR